MGKREEETRERRRQEGGGGDQIEHCNFPYQPHHFNYLNSSLPSIGHTIRTVNRKCKFRGSFLQRLRAKKHACVTQFCSKEVILYSLPTLSFSALSLSLSLLKGEELSLLQLSTVFIISLHSSYSTYTSSPSS